MDPEETLNKTETLIREGAYQDAKEMLENYFEWRRSGGFEPKDGDARASKIAKCTLEEILLAMDPCDDAREWILNEKARFGTLAEAISACPRMSWLEWAVCELPKVTGGLEYELDDCMWTEKKNFLLLPANLERCALGLFEYAMEKGIIP